MGYTIRAAHIKNLKSIREAALTDCDSMVLVGGKNGAGKSNVLAILGGAVGFPWPDDLLRDGQEKGEATVELVDGDEHYTVAISAWRAKARGTDEFTGAVSTKLTITQGEGDDVRQIMKPRQWLANRLSGKHFDVLELIDDFDTPKGRRDVAERLRGIAGLDFSELDEEIAAIAETRKDAKRDMAAAEAARDAIPKDPECPKAVVVADLLAERNKKAGDNEHSDNEQAAHERIREEQKVVCDHTRAEIARLQGVLAIAQTNVSKANAATVAFAAKPRADVAALDTAIENAEAVNARVRAQAERKTRAEQVTLHAKKAAEADRQIGELVDEKKATLASADLGVEGLSFAEDLETLLWQGEPLWRKSDGEKIAIFAQLHAAQNPQIGVMFSTRASLLDDEHLAICDRVARDNGMQFIFEYVCEEREGAFIIEATEDGSVLCPSK